jgi:hypothetical protein
MNQSQRPLPSSTGSDRSPVRSTRRRGGQPGNRNALKHGFYAAQLRKADLKDLEACRSAGLVDEINLLRVHIRRVVELGAGVDQLDQSIDLLRSLCFAAVCLTRLIKAHAFLAIQQVYEELVLNNLSVDKPTPNLPAHTDE